MILAAGLTPAWQRILRFERFVPGEVNRAAEAVACGSGKVVNVGVAAHHLSGPSLALTVVGGTTGASIRADLATLGVPARWIETDVPTRVCTTILDDATGRTTELVENAAPLAKETLSATVAAFSEEARGATHVVLSGSLPPGTPAGFYRELMERTPRGVPVILDARGVELTAALPLRPFLVKPNLEELSRTAGRVLESDEAVWDAMWSLNRGGATWVAVSQGGGAVRLSSLETRHSFVPPAIRAVNPIGCGDSLAAGIAWGLREGMSPQDAVRFGIGAAGDNLSQLLPARLDAVRAQALASLVAT